MARLGRPARLAPVVNPAQSPRHAHISRRLSCPKISPRVVPAKAGTHPPQPIERTRRIGPRLRGDDHCGDACDTSQSSTCGDAPGHRLSRCVARGSGEGRQALARAGTADRCEPRALPPAVRRRRKILARQGDRPGHGAGHGVRTQVRRGGANRPWRRRALTWNRREIVASRGSGLENTNDRPACFAVPPGRRPVRPSRSGPLVRPRSGP